jgi:tripartite-type tricarboxylate transporter receptor subunit TctC
MTITRRAFVGAALAGSVAWPGYAAAQTGGAAMKIVFPFGAGGTGDALCRYLGDILAKSLNRAVIIENRTGADGRIGIQSVKAAAPDGDTLLVTTGPTMALMPQIHKSAGYDPVVDFEPVAHLARFEFCIVVANNVPAKTVAELVTWMKANPDKATYALPGLGTIPHFAGVSLSKIIGVDMRRLPYRGGAPAMNDLVGGQVPIGFMTLSDALQQHLGGQVKMIATLGKTRSPFVPDVPTLIEQGFAIEGDAWYGMWAPTKTPKDVIAKVNAALISVLGSAEGKAKLTSLGLIATGTSPAELATIRQAMADIWAPTIKASGFTLEQ